MSWAEQEVRIMEAAIYNGVEKRAEHRRKMLKGGTVYFNKGYSSLECVLRDVSSNGARIQMGETFGMPSRVLLSISGEEGRVEASVRWRNSRNIGLSFAPHAN
jgi:PilZ domain